MEMKQMVYVVIDSENGVTGVWNEFQDAENHVDEHSVIVPVIVDQYGHRDGCETSGEVVTAMKKELQNMYASYSDSDDNNDDDEEEEDEDDYDMFSSFFDDDDDEEHNDEDDDANDTIRGLLDMLFD